VTALRRLWRGELPLSDAFWNWAVIGGIIVNVPTTILSLTLIMNGRPLAAFIAGYAISVPYNVVATVGVWRAAARYEGDRKWADLARIVTVVGMVLLTIT
jgi:hypothetical protein